MDLKKFSLKLTKEQQKQAFLGVVALLAFVYVYGKFFLGPVNRSIAARREELTQLTAKLDEAKREAEQLSRLQSDLVALQAEIKASEAQLPTTKQIPDMLRLVTKTAALHRVAISRFEPKPQQLASNQIFYQLPFGVTMSGSYHDLAKFLTDMGASVRIISPDRLQITGKTGSDNKQITIEATFDLVAYTYKG